VQAFERVRQWARTLRRDVLALYLAARDPRVPWYAKAVAACVAVYALSPIDLIPDFIPVLGYLDDVIIVPLGIWLAIRLIPPSLLEAHRQAALARHQPHPVSWVGAIIILILWGIAGGAMVWWLASYVLGSPEVGEIRTSVIAAMISRKPGSPACFGSSFIEIF
jgi:uncharacterized membrane protein YkvA (DUF1232 family)